MMLKLKPQYSGHLMRRSDSLEKTLLLEKIERRRIGRQKMRWLDSITDSDSMDMSLSKLPETLEKRGAMGSQRVGQDLVTEQQQILKE